MKMGELIRYDIPPEIIRLWQERESDTLLPMQEMAIKRHNLFLANRLQDTAPLVSQNGAARAAEGASPVAPHRNLLIQAPTSSGKTFIGEMAAIQTALRRKKVVYLVPLKALAEEKYVEFKEKYKPYGIEVIISTRDHREFDAALEGGNFSIAVVVYEKLAQLMVRRPERFQEVELVIADELEILSDPERGALVELLLTSVLRTKSRLIGLSAVIGHADRLAQWFDADLLVHERRPVELRYGVIHEGIFKYRMYNEYEEGEEDVVHVFSESAWEILTENVHAFAEHGEPCLVFVKAKHESRRGAELLCRRLELPAATDAIEALKDLEPTHSRDRLIETLNHGIAFHNADLAREERRIIEQAFRNGEIMVMVSTSTLAMGMNTPAQNVFIATDKWQYDNRFGMPWKTPILRAEYENMGGRAGRLSKLGTVPSERASKGRERDGTVPNLRPANSRPEPKRASFGRSILIAPTPFDFETYWRRYIEGEREKVEPRLAQQPLDDHILRLVAARTCLTEEELRDFLDHTLSGQWIWAETLTLDEVEFKVRVAVNRLLDEGMVSKNGEGRLEATPFGQAVAAKGITVATAREIAQWVNESETRIWSDIDLILAAALTPDGRMVQVMLTAREYEHADYHGLLKRRTQDEDIHADAPLNRLRNCTLQPFFEEVRAIKVALFLMQWLDEAAAYDIEEEFKTLKGQIVSAAEQISWLVDATAAIATAFGAQPAFIERITVLAERVARGLREDTLPLARLKEPALSRSAVLLLAAQGMHTVDAIREAPIGQLTQWVSSHEAHALKAWAQRAAKPASESGEHTSPTPSANTAIPVLIVDDKHPGGICLDGRRVELQEKQYLLIRALAAFPGECVPYDTIYQAVWGELVVESNQMHFQKKLLLQRIREVASQHDKLVTTVPKRGFVLNLKPNQVVLHQAAMTTAA